MEGPKTNNSAWDQCSALISEHICPIISTLIALCFAGFFGWFLNTRDTTQLAQRNSENIDKLTTTLDKVDDKLDDINSRLGVIQYRVDTERARSPAAKPD